MELRQLRYFVSAASHLSFTKAAKECFIVQSSMAEQIANLEKELGVRLFDRHRKGLVLTEAGEFFLPRAKAVLAEAQRGQEEMSSFQAGYRCLLRIGYLGELFKTDLIQSLTGYRKEFPKVRVSLRQLPEQELLEGLRDGQLDVIVRSYEDDLVQEKDWLEWEPLVEIGPMLAMAKDHLLADRESITMAELEDIPFIALGDGALEDLKEPPELDRSKARNVELTMDHASNEILVASGYGVSFWAWGLNRRGRNPDLKFVKVSDWPKTKRYILAWKRGRLTPEGEAFCRRFEQEVKGDG